MTKNINGIPAGPAMTAVGGLYLLAALVHNAGSCFVVLPAALLYDRRYPGPDAPRDGEKND